MFMTAGPPHRGWDVEVGVIAGGLSVAVWRRATGSNGRVVRVGID
jgi:hypothetical protein